MARVQCRSCQVIISVPHGAPTTQCPMCHTTIVCANSNGYVVPAANRRNGYANNFPIAGYANNYPSAGYANYPNAGYTNNYPSAGYTNNYPSAGYTNNYPSAGYTNNYPSAGYTNNYPSGGYAPNYPTADYKVRPSPSPMHGRKRALLIGISYHGQKVSVKGSVNDVKLMKHLLTSKMGFPNEAVLVLTEEEMDPYRMPTRKNIEWSFQWLLQGSKSGDSLVFFYSGHGSKVSDVSQDEVDGFDESLCPVDYATAGKILDDQINDALVRPLLPGVTLHAIVDTCRSGTLLDLPYMCRMDQRGCYAWEDHRTSTAYKGTSGGRAICISACDDHETSLDTTAFTDTVTGAMTYCFIETLENEPGLTYARLLKSLRTKIAETQKRVYGFQLGANAPTAQVPQISSCEMFDIYSTPFKL